MANSKQKTAPKKDAKSILIKIGVIAFIVAFVLVLAFSTLRYTTGIVHRMITAVKVGNEKVSAMDLRILFQDTRSQYLYNYGYILQMYGYDLSTIDSQTCLMDSSMSWGEYFLNQGINQATNALMLTIMAEKNGYEASDEVEANVKEYIASIKEAAKEDGVSVRKYLRNIYGRGTSLNDIERVALLTNYASEYYNHIYDGYFDGATADEIQKYYEEHKDEFDAVSYYSLSVPFEEYEYEEPKEGETIPEGQPKSKEEATTMTEAAKTEAKAKADAILAEITDASNFDEVAKKHWTELGNEDEFETALTSGVVTDTTSVVGKWYSASDIKAGDKTVLDNSEDGEYTVVLYVERAREEIETVNVRHILIACDEASDDMTDEEKAEIAKKDAEAKAKAEKILADFKAGTVSAEAFGELADEYTEDTGSLGNGGLYENVVPNEMVEEFNDWIFDESRKEGDTDIVKTVNGYHVMYFAGEGMVKYEETIRTALADEDYNAFFEEHTKGLKSKTTNLGVLLIYS